MSYFYSPCHELEEAVDAYFGSISKWADDNAEAALTVVLLGSLSRGEGTWIEDGGRVAMVSDVEFFTVISDGFDKHEEYDHFVHEEARRVFSPYMTDLFHVDNTFVRRKKLTKLEKKLLTYDAVNFGKCVVGSDVMPMLPQVNLNNINLYDIHDILIHRVFSVLYYGRPLKDEGELAQYRYNLAKNSLDLMTVLLVENDMLESGFIRRYEAIKELSIKQSVKDYFGYCLSLKLRIATKSDYSISEMEEMLVALVTDLDRSFVFRLRNIAANVPSIARRKAGVLKRALIAKALPERDYLDKLVSILNDGGTLSKQILRSNYILNGYPPLRKLDR